MACMEIKAVDSKVVHKICSGQVVLNLTNALKELIENSLDADTTSIDIRFKEYGVESIEVIDNGTGIQESNFPFITMKHYTSKLIEFDDLVNVETYGFRGEALSSLCALCNLIVITRHISSSTATRLEFDHDGNIVKQVSVSRPKGTTVILNNLFSTLPVRHKEFTKNIKKEFAKMLNLIYGYCLISENVRLLCSNQTNKSKNVLISSNQGCRLSERIINIFGHKQASGLLELKSCLPAVDILAEYGLSEKDFESSQIKVSGCISSCGQGCGRSSADRQFYFINRRPCDLPKLSKLINSIYHEYNHSQFPFVVLDITTEKNFVDVNVTPDKRLLLLNNEKVLFAVVKAALKSHFESDQRILKGAAANKVENEITITQWMKSPEDAEFSKQENSTNEENRIVERPNVPDVITPTITKGSPNVQFLSNFKRKSDTPTSTKNELRKRIRTLDNYITSNESTNINIEMETSQVGDDQIGLKDLMLQTANAKPNLVIEISTPKFNYELRCKTDDDATEVEKESAFTKEPCEENISKKVIPFSLNYLHKYYPFANRNSLSSKSSYRKFKAKIEPGSNELAENELRKELSKDMFKSMAVIGQFNLGFIITKCNSDLFIIDQHATDEKFNYEDLKKNIILKTQKLIIDKPLNLSAANEILLSENLEIFQRNGFTFSQTTENERSNYSLTGIPVSKNWTFGKEDIEEMLFMMSEGVIPGEAYRPTRIQQMLASRACRKSVMIGTALNFFTMRKLVSHMADMDQPWNCPHGRPTIRCLINLASIDLV